MAEAIRKCGLIVLQLVVRIFPADRQAGWVKSRRSNDLHGK